MYWKRGTLLPKKELIDLLIKKGFRKKEIANLYGCSVSIVNKTIYKFNIDSLYDRYVRYLYNSGLRQCEICKKINRDQAAISRRLSKLGIDGTINKMERAKETLIHKYGVDNCQKIDSVRKKTKLTNLERYGYDTPLRIFNCHFTGLWDKIGDKALEKSRLSSISHKEYIFPSGKIVNIQGYEGRCLDILLDIYEENDIHVERDVPVIKYFDNKDNKHRKHYPDIFISSENMIIEVKSTYIKSITKNLMEKYFAAKEQGYSYEIWVFDDKELREIV